MKIDPDDLISQADAARIRGVSHQAIVHLVKQGRFKVSKIGGRIFLSRTEVESYRPGKPGPHPKEKARTSQTKISNKSR